MSKNRASGLDPGIQIPLIDDLTSKDRSALRKYQEVYVGNTSILGLLKYELLTSLFAPMPGALGLLLRRAAVSFLLGDVGQGVVVGSHVTFRCPARITLGHEVFVAGHSVMDAKGQESSIRLGNSVLIGRGSILSCSAGRIELGNDVTLGPGCYVRAGMGPILIGSDVTIGAHSILISGSPDHRRLDIPMHRQLGSHEGVRVGNDVWIGVGVRIVDGVTVGSGSVVGAGAVVVEDVPELAIVAGVPAKVISMRAGPTL